MNSERKSSESRGTAIVAGILTSALGAYLLLHFIDPDLSITWSYAHLHRRPALPWIGLGLVVLLPPGVSALWRAPVLRQPVGAPSVTQTGAALSLLYLALFASSLWSPQTPHAVDSVEFLLGTTEPGFHYNPRWYLSIRLYRLVSSVLVPPIDPERFARGANALLGAIAMMGFAGCARRLADTRGEAIALVALVWSSFGVLQISVGYLDIYPVPLAATGLYLWLAFRVLEGRSTLWGPFLIVGLGPFFYIGLILLAPPTIFLVYDVVRRDGNLRRVWPPAMFTLLGAVLATYAGHGRPLAWADWYAEAALAASCDWGLQSGSCLLPFGYMFSAEHWNEMAHLLLLVDFVGLLLFAVCTSSELLRDLTRIDLRVLVLGSVGAAHFAFLLVLDPLFGQYSDWDAYTYPAVPITLLGGWGFVLWGRRSPRWFGLLLGLALAAASVHLLARLNAIHVDRRAHLLETPCHVNCGPPGSYYESCRHCAWDGVLLLCECRTRKGTWRPTGAMTDCARGFFNDDGVLRCG